VTQLRRDVLILNDVHIGVNRVAGASPVTAYALRQRVLKEFESTLMAHPDNDVVINGDLFDAYDIAMGDAFACYMALVQWLEQHDVTDTGAPQLVLARAITTSRRTRRACRCSTSCRASSWPRTRSA
jgi:hypothetical protein